MRCNMILNEYVWDSVAIHLKLFSVTIPDNDAFTVESSIIIYLIHSVTVMKKNISAYKPEWCSIPVAQDKSYIWILSLAEEIHSYAMRLMGLMLVVY